MATIPKFLNEYSLPPHKMQRWQTSFQNSDGYYTKVLERIHFATTHNVKMANIGRHRSYWTINRPKHDKTFVDPTLIGQYTPKYDENLYTLPLLGDQS
jgi:hypothetical protein